MKFTPVSTNDVPTITRGRTQDSATAQLIGDFLDSGNEAAKITDLGDEKLASVATKLGSFCRRQRKPVVVSMRAGALFLLRDENAPEHYRELDAKVAERNAKKAAEADATETSESTEDADSQTFEGSDEDSSWEDEGSELA